MTNKKQALLIIDMMNTLEFPEGPQLLKQAMPAAIKIKSLKLKFKKKKWPIIYVNDNFDHWAASWQDIYERCSQPAARGRDLAILLKPEKNDYFVLKPKLSGFFSTSLEVLLKDLNVKRLVLTGLAGNICVYFTAYDAHVRDFELIVPKDCIASNTKKENDFALDQVRSVFSGQTTASTSLKLY